MKHFCIINKETNIVECIVTVEEETSNPIDGYYEIEVPEHDPSLFDKKYENGEFVEA